MCVCVCVLFVYILMLDIEEIESPLAAPSGRNSDLALIYLDLDKASHRLGWWVALSLIYLSIAMYNTSRSILGCAPPRPAGSPCPSISLHRSIYLNINLSFYNYLFTSGYLDIYNAAPPRPAGSPSISLD